jgi:hypothetical protein
VAAAIPHHGPSSRLTASPIRESRTGFVAAQTFGATTRRRDRPGVVSVHRIRAVRLVSRYDRDHTRRFPELVKALGTLEAKSFALAGEVAVFDQALVSRWLRGRTADEPATLPVCIVFDGWNSTGVICVGSRCGSGAECTHTMRSPPDVNHRTLGGIGLGLAQHLVRHRSDVALAEGDVLEEIQHGIALGPTKVDVRDLARALPQMEEEGGNGIGHGGTLGPEHTMAADAQALDPKDARERAGVLHADLEEDHGGVRRQMMVLPLWYALHARTPRRPRGPGDWR